MQKFDVNLVGEGVWLMVWPVFWSWKAKTFVGFVKSKTFGRTKSAAEPVLCKVADTSVRISTY